MLKRAKNLRATTKLSDVIEHADLLMVLVATPTGIAKDQAYDCGTLSKVLSDMNDRKLSNKHVVICCTVMPGYVDQIGKHLLRDCTNTSLSYNPEFIAQGDVIHGLLNPDMVLIGEGSPQAGDLLQSLYERCVKNQPRFSRMSPASAEICKLSVNCFITTKISFANYVGDIADATRNADKFAILQACGADSRIGHKYLLPGFGYGGPCFPRDNRALGYYAAMVGVEPLISQAQQLLKQNQSQYVMEDVAYKSKCPVDIIEESHVLEVAKRLVKAGKKVVIKDRRGIVELVRRTYGSLFEYQVVGSADGDANVNWGNAMGSYKR
jgi:UDPglucose 6-dehydrogenase